MGKSNVKTKKFSKKKIALIAVASVLFCLILTVSLMFGIGACHKQSITEAPKSTVTVRKELPSDGASPVKSDGLDNIGYMAYVLDHQPSYHAYASNSTKSTGYEQVTRTWKDYVSAEKSGYSENVMICSDLSYSSLIKSASQTAFVGADHAYMRGGSKPGKDTLPTDIQWSESAPTHYTHEKYQTTYGDFSTELSVYILNKYTVDSWDEVTDNGDGTYTQKFYLNSQAAYWYQYGMKTRGGLKGYPKFERIELSFTFDSNYQVLGSYCEEKTQIAPSALGGVPLPSTSKTTTEYFYDEQNFDNGHYGYFDNFFKDNLDSAVDPDEVKNEPALLDVLGGAFSQVVAADGNGQQFALGLNVGDTDYTGKIYLKLADMSDVLGTLDARVALEKKDTGKQDFYLELKNGDINAYYGDGFAMTADIAEVSASVGRITQWVKSFDKKTDNPVPAKYVLAAAEEQSEGLDLSTLLNELKFTLTKTSASIALNSENLLGLGIGIDAKLDFTRTIDEEGYSTFGLVSVDLKKLSFGGEDLALKGEIVPDSSEIIKRDIASTPANLAEYIDGIYGILSSNTVKVDLSLGDKLVEGLSLDAEAYAVIGSEIATRVDVQAAYKDISIKLNAYYAYGGGYGEVYLHVTEVCGQAVNAKVYCDIEDAVETIKNIIDLFKTEGDGAPDSGETEGGESGNKLAEIINKVLKLNLGRVITQVTGNSSELGVAVNVDELLKGLDIDLGIGFGLLDLKLLNNGGVVSLEANLPELALGLGVSGSDKALARITEEEAEKYVDLVSYLESVYALLKSETIKVDISLDGTLIEGLQLNAVAFVNIKDEIATRVDVEAEYKGISVKLNAFYVFDGGYGKVYLNVTEIGGQEVNAKVYCDIKDTVNAVTDLINLFKQPEEKAVALTETKEADTLGKVLGVVLGLDFNEILKADNNSLEIKMNVDEILSGFDVNPGIQLGTVVLTYDKEKLTGELPALGLDVVVSGSEQSISAPEDTENYVDINGYLKSVYALLNSETLKVDISLDGTLVEGLQLNAVAFVNIKDEIATRVDVEAEYKGISVKLNAFYVFDGGYGKVYLNVTEIGGQEVNAKVYCDIKDTVNAVTDLINLFKQPEEQAVAFAETEEADTLGKVLGVVLGLDFNEILKADNNSLEIKVNVDEILSGFDVNPGIQLGTVVLTYDKEKLTGELPALGLDVVVSGSEQSVSAPEDTGSYVDVTRYVTSVTNLLKGGKFGVTLNISGETEIEKLKGITASGTAVVEFKGDDKKTLAVNLNEVKAGYGEISLAFNAYYEINFNNLSAPDYGTVYLNITELFGKQINAKITCNIADAVTAVKEIIALFPQKTELSAQSDEAQEEQDKLADIIGVILGLDFNSIISADNDSVNLTVNADDLLGKFGLNLGIDWLSFGELKLALKTNNNVASLEGGLAKLGLTLGLSASETGAEKPADDGNYVDVVSYIQSVTALLKGGKFNVHINFNGTEQIKELKGITAEVNAVVEFTGADNKTVAVSLENAKVGYNNLTVVFDAYYEVNIGNIKDSYGKVFLNVKQVGEQTGLSAKVYADISQAVKAVEDIIALFKKPEPEAPSAPAAQAESASALDTALSIILGLDYNSLIKADNGGFTLTVNADEVIGDLVKLPVTLGTVTLTYDKSEFVGTVPALGLTLGLSASETGAEKPEDEGNYVDVVNYVNGVKNLLEGGKFGVTLNISGVTEIEKLKGITASGTAVVEFTGADKKTIAVNLNNVTASYEYAENKFASITFNAYYEINLNNINVSDYGVVYLNITELCGQEINAKVKCDIADAVTAVKEIIALFPKESGLSAQSDEAQEEQNKLADIVGVILGLDFNSIINADNNSVNLTVDADELLGKFGVDLGVDWLKFGELKLALNNNKVTEEDGTQKYVASLEGGLAKLGLTLGLGASANGAVKPEDECNYVDAIAYVNEIKEIVLGGKYHAQIVIDGLTEGNQAIEMLNGVYAKVVADVQFKGADKKTIAVNLSELNVKYSGYSVTLKAYYEKDFNTSSYGTVYLNITEINGTALNAKVVCEIDKAAEAVQRIIALVNPPAEDNGQTPDAQSDSKPLVSADVTVGKVIDTVLGLDFATLIKADNSSLSLTLDADEILKGIGVQFGIEGLEFGTVNLKFSKEAKVEEEVIPAAFTGDVAKLGLSATVTRFDGELGIPEDSANYIDVAQLLGIAENAIKEVKAIIDGKDIAFNVTADATLKDSSKLNIAGDGEVIWSDGKIIVAVGLTLTVKDTSFALNFIYDGAAIEDETSGLKQPIVRLTLDGYGFDKVGLNVYRSEIDELRTTVDNLIAAINGAPAGGNTQPANPVGGESQPENGEVQPQNEGGKIGVLDVLQSENVKTVLSKILGFISDLTVTLDGTDAGDITDLVIDYAKKDTLTLGTDGKLSVNVNVDKKADVTACVEAGEGATVQAIKQAVSAVKTENEVEKPVYSQNNLETFSKVIYDWFFNTLDGEFTLKDLLGEAYRTTVVLDGNQSEIAALKDIYVKADLAYAELDGGKKLVQADLTLNIKGTTVRASASYYNKAFYITLKEVAGVNLYMQNLTDDLKIKAGTDDIYLAVETLVKLITENDVASVIKQLMGEPKQDTGAGGETQPENPENGIVTLSEESKFALTDVLNTLLTLDFGALIKLENGDLSVDVDGLLTAFGVSGVTVGEFDGALDKENKKLSASLTVAGKEGSWLTINAAPAQVSEMTVPDAASYLDVGFLKDLVSDLTNTLTDGNGEIHQLYSFSGKATIHVFVPKSLIKEYIKLFGFDLNADIVINVTTLTVGFDEEGEFYFTLMGALQESEVFGLTLASPSNIAINYSKGYVTLGRGIGTGDVQYKVMSLNYLLDNLLVKNKDGNDSPARWLLGMSDTIWNIVVGAVPSGSVSSGVSKPDTYRLYGDNVVGVEEKVENFILRNYLNFLAVKIADGTNYSFGYGEANADKALNAFLNDTEHFSFGGSNYYAFDINGRRLLSMIDHLYAGIYRTPEQGVTGLAAEAGLIASDVKITAYINLNTYLEGAEIYSPEKHGTTLTGKQAPNFLNIVNSGVTGGIDFTHIEGTPKDPAVSTLEFGCYDTASGYKDLEVLTKYTLTIVGSDGTEEVILKYGSTVNAEGFKAVDENHKLVYTYDEEGNDPVETFILTGDKTIYAHSVEIHKTVRFHLAGDKYVDYPITSDGEALPALEDAGYTFLGWYKDSGFNGEALTTYSDELGTDIYGKFVRTEVIAENGVKYEFVNNEGGYYVATGLDADAASDSGYLNKSTRQGVDGEVNEINLLELANVIDGYPVKEIAANAFNVANTGVYLVNVVVPENVVKVGASAFKDNYDIRQVIFLAQKVGFYGDASKDKKTIPFFGCSIADGGETTNLTVYYNEIYTIEDSYSGKDGNPSWSLFRWAGSSVSDKPRFIGNDGAGKRVSSGWAYVEYEFEYLNGAENGKYVKEFNSINYGLVFTAQSAEDIQSAILKEINGHTATENYINAYSVTVENGITLTGKCTVKITISLNEAEKCYLVNFNNAYAYIEGTVQFENNRYAKNGSVLKILPVSGYEITSARWNDNNIGSSDYSFTVSVSGNVTDFTVNIEAECREKQFTQITLSSQVNFTYNGTDYYTSLTVNAIKGDDMPVAPTAEDSKYTFIGWAYKSDDTTMMFEGATVQYEEYTAIWAYSETGATFAFGELVGSKLPSVTVSAGDGEFYKWYSDSTFKTSISELSTDNLILYIRLKYNISLSLNAGSTTWYLAEFDGDIKDDGSSDIGFTKNLINQNTGVTGGTVIDNPSNLVLSMYVLEGDKVEVHRYWENGIVIKLYEGTSVIKSYLIKGCYNTVRVGTNYDWRKQFNNDTHYIEYISGKWFDLEGLDKKEVDGKNRYFKSGGTQLFGTANDVKSNLAFTVQA